MRVLHLSGELIREWGTYGSGNGEFNWPMGIDIYNEEVFVVDTENARIQVFDLLGNYKRQWQTGEDTYPIEIKIYNNRAYITDDGTGSIMVFSLSGNLIAQFPLPYDEEEENFPEPVGIDIYLDKIYCADPGNNRIVVFDIDGNLITTWEWEEYLWDRPMGIKVYKEKIYIVSEQTHEVFILRLDGSYNRQWESNGSYNIGLFENQAFVVYHDHIDVYSLDGIFQRTIYFTSGPQYEFILSEDDRIFTSSMGNWTKFVESGDGTVSVAVDPLGEKGNTLAFTQGGEIGTFGAELVYPAFTLTPGKTYQFHSCALRHPADLGEFNTQLYIQDDIHDPIINVLAGGYGDFWEENTFIVQIPTNWNQTKIVMKVILTHFMTGRGVYITDFSLKEYIYRDLWGIKLLQLSQ